MSPNPSNIARDDDLHQVHIQPAGVGCASCRQLMSEVHELNAELEHRGVMYASDHEIWLEQMHRLKEENANLRAALKPFAAVMENLLFMEQHALAVGHYSPAEDECHAEVKVIHLRRAREALGMGEQP